MVKDCNAVCSRRELLLFVESTCVRFEVDLRSLRITGDRRESVIVSYDFRIHRGSGFGRGIFDSTREFINVALRFIAREILRLVPREKRNKQTESENKQGCG